MDTELKTSVIPVLRELGFKGTMPHLRRKRNNGMDLLTFQFDKHGGGFVVEIARCGDDGFTTHWGQHIPASKMKAWDLHPNDRHRIKPREGSGTDAWFRYDQGGYIAAATDFLKQLPRAEEWWLAH